MKMLHRYSYRIVTVKGNPSGQHLIKNDPGGINIARCLSAFASGLFGRKIMYRTHDVVSARQRRAVGNAGDPEVRHLNMPVCVNKNILRLNIPMNDPVSVSVLQGAENTNGNLAGQGRSQLASFLNHFLQGFPLNIFHHQVTVFVIHAYIQQVNNIVMGHFAGSFRFTLKAADKLYIFIKLRPEYLYRHIVPGSQINSAINNRHPAHADLFRQAITSRQDSFSHHDSPPAYDLQDSVSEKDPDRNEQKNLNKVFLFLRTHHGRISFRGPENHLPQNRLLLYRDRSDRPAG